MPGEDIQSWSITAINNGTADPLCNWVEGQARASVNDSARSVMAALAKWRDLRNGSITTGGTPNAQTFTEPVGYTSVPTGLRVTLRIGPGLTNTGSVSLNMNGTGAVVVGKPQGGTLAPGDLVAFAYCDFIHNGVNWVLLQGGGTNLLGNQSGTPAPAGYIGEVLSALGTNVLCNISGITAIAQLTLTPGDWDLTAGWFLHSGNPSRAFFGSITENPAATDNTPGNICSSYTDSSGNVAFVAGPVGRMITANLTTYAVCYNPNSDGAILGDAKLFARRVR